MNIHDFLYTVAISSGVGFLFGYFAKSIYLRCKKLVKVNLLSPKYLKKTEI